MSKSEELLRMERDMSEQPELREKLDAEIKRVAEAGEAPLIVRAEMISFADIMNRAPGIPLPDTSAITSARWFSSTGK